MYLFSFFTHVVTTKLLKIVCFLEIINIEFLNLKCDTLPPTRISFNFSKNFKSLKAHVVGSRNASLSFSLVPSMFGKIMGKRIIEQRKAVAKSDFSRDFGRSPFVTVILYAVTSENVLRFKMHARIFRCSVLTRYISRKKNWNKVRVSEDVNYIVPCTCHIVIVTNDRAYERPRGKRFSFFCHGSDCVRRNAEAMLPAAHCSSRCPGNEATGEGEKGSSRYNDCRWRNMMAGYDRCVCHCVSYETDRRNNTRESSEALSPVVNTIRQRPIAV